MPTHFVAERSSRNRAFRLSQIWQKMRISGDLTPHPIASATLAYPDEYLPQVLEWNSIRSLPLVLSRLLFEPSAKQGMSTECHTKAAELHSDAAKSHAAAAAMHDKGDDSAAMAESTKAHSTSAVAHSTSTDAHIKTCCCGSGRK
jgi:hypothetical protein